MIINTVLKCTYLKILQNIFWQNCKNCFYKFNHRILFKSTGVGLIDNLFIVNTIIDVQIILTLFLKKKIFYLWVDL